MNTDSIDIITGPQAAWLYAEAIFDCVLVVLCVAVNATMIILTVGVDVTFLPMLFLAFLFLNPFGAISYARHNAPRRWRQARAKRWSAYQAA